jgi:hypothetical protein
MRSEAAGALPPLPEPLISALPLPVPFPKRTITRGQMGAAPEPSDQSACEIYRLSDRHLLAKFSELLRIEGCRVVSAADPSRPLISVF